MKRILLISSLIVATVLFALERNVIYFLFITVTTALYLLLLVAHRKRAQERAADGLGMTRQTDAASTEHKKLGDQAVSHT
jgi:hypothetical protein